MKQNSSANSSKSNKSNKFEEFATWHKIYAKYKPLTAEEEAELLKRAKKGNEKAKEELTNRVMRYALKKMSKFVNDNISINDLMTPAYFGLDEAISKYDETKGTRFCTYADPWITKYLYIAVDELLDGVHVPHNMKTKYNKVHREYEAYVQEHDGEAPSVEELAHRCGMTIKEVNDALAVNYTIKSLDAGWSPEADDEEEGEMDCSCTGEEEDNEQGEGGNFISLYVKVNLETWIDQKELLRLLEEEINKSDEKTQKVLKMHFGVFGSKEYNMDEIAKEIGKSTETVRQIRNKALQSLNRRLAPYRYAA